MTRSSIRDEIYNLLRDDWLTQREPMNYRLHMQTELILRIFEKRLNELDEEYKLKVKGAKYQTGYYNALLDVRDILK